MSVERIGTRKLPPTNPDASRRHQEEAAALALLLAATRRRYDLPALIRAARARTRPFRQIRPTHALAYDMAAPHLSVAAAWQGELDTLIQAYALGSPEAIRVAARAATARVAAVLPGAEAAIRAAVANAERWHRAQWVSRIRASTGIDVSMFTQPGDVADDMVATTAWNGQLTEDVHRQIGSGLTSALFAGFAASSPAAEVQARARDVIAKGRDRASAIGGDQIHKLSRAMDRSRREAASLTKYVWHHVPQRHPRNWHLARDGKTFGPGDIDPADRAGVPPFCRCWEQPLFGPPNPP